MRLRYTRGQRLIDETRPSHPSPPPPVRGAHGSSCMYQIGHSPRQVSSHLELYWYCVRGREDAHVMNNDAALAEGACSLVEAGA